MPKPYEFKSESELIELLRHEKTRAAAREYFSAQTTTVSGVVHTGVASNTYRAFHNLSVRPSVMFRSWAVNYLKQSIAGLTAISTHAAYSTYVHDATISLCDQWRKLTGAEIGYGRGAKLFNLVLKKFACLQSLSTEQKSVLIRLQHVPLDSYTIIGLRSVAPELSIPRNATMKYIESQLQYAAFQQRIAAIASDAGVPPIYYDILAWDMGH